LSSEIFKYSIALIKVVIIMDWQLALIQTIFGTKKMEGGAVLPEKTTSGLEPPEIVIPYFTFAPDIKPPIKPPRDKKDDKKDDDKFHDFICSRTIPDSVATDYILSSLNKVKIGPKGRELIYRALTEVPIYIMDHERWRELIGKDKSGVYVVGDDSILIPYGLPPETLAKTLVHEYWHSLQYRAGLPLDERDAYNIEKYVIN
jgi:hypothetical protein